MKLRQRTASSCWVGSLKVKKYSCSLQGGFRWKALWSEKSQGTLLPGATCEIQHTPKPGSHAKSNGPSNHHLRAPGHLAPDPPNKNLFFFLNEHKSKACVQGPQKFCFLANLGEAPGHTLGPGFYMYCWLPDSRRDLTPVLIYVHTFPNLTSSLSFSG